MAKKKLKVDFDELIENAHLKNNAEEDIKTGGIKSFTTTLEAFLQNAIEESIEEQARPAKKNEKKPPTPNTKPPKTTKRSNKLGGLDLLIQETVESSEVETVFDGDFKRVTILFDKEKIEKLYTIARAEHAYVRDIVNQLVGEYIRRYEGVSR